MFRMLSTLALGFLISPICLGQAVSTQVSPCEQRSSAAKSTSNLVSQPNTAPTDQSSSTKIDGSADRVQIEFEGLRAFPKADVLISFREERVSLAEAKVPCQADIDNASTALKRLLQNRGYMDPSIYGTVVDGVKVVRFVIQEGPRYSFGILSFEGNERISSDELASPLRECLSNYSERTKSGYDREVLDFCHRRLMTFATSRGYLQAKYLEPKISVSGMSVNVTIPIDEGPVYRLGEIKFEGAEAFSPVELEALCPIRRGEVAESEKLAKWLFEDLRAAYGEKGFIQYTAEPQPIFISNPEDKDDNVVDLKVTIDEGKRFKVGSITFRGDTLSPKELNSMLLLRAGDFYNDQLFAESVRRVNNSGLFENVDRDKDSEFRTDDEGGSVAIVFTLHRKAKLP
jgi:Outer membrane protein/protective antigen OMA87